MSLLDFLFGNTAPTKQPITLPGADNSNTMTIQGPVKTPYKPMVQLRGAPPPAAAPAQPAVPPPAAAAPINPMPQAPQPAQSVSAMPTVSSPIAPRTIIPPMKSGMNLNDPSVLAAATALMKEEQQKQKVAEFFKLPMSGAGTVKNDTTTMNAPKLNLPQFSLADKAKAAGYNVGAGAMGELFNIFGGDTGNSGEQEALAQAELKRGNYESAQKILDEFHKQQDYDKTVNPLTGNANPSLMGAANQDTLLNSLSKGIGSFLPAMAAGGEAKVGELAEEGAAKPIAWILSHFDSVPISTLSKIGAVGTRTAAASALSPVFTALHSKSPQDFATHVVSDYKAMFPAIAATEGLSGVIGLGSKALGLFMRAATEHDVPAADITRQNLSNLIEGKKVSEPLQMAWKSMTGEQRMMLMKSHVDDKIAMGENRLAKKTGPETSGEPKPEPKPIPSDKENLTSPRIESLQDEISNHERNIASYEDLIKQNPVAGLMKNLGKKEGDLPAEGGKSKFAQNEDTLAQKLASEHGQTGIADAHGQADTGMMRDKFDQVRATVEKLKDEKRQLANKKIELSHLQKAAQAGDDVTRGGFLKAAKNAKNVNARGEVHPTLQTDPLAAIKQPTGEFDPSPAEQSAMQKFEDSLSPEDKKAIEQNKPMDRTLALAHIKAAEEQLAKMPEGPGKEMQREAIKAMKQKAETFGQQQQRLRILEKQRADTAEKTASKQSRIIEAQNQERTSQEIKNILKTTKNLPVAIQDRMHEISRNFDEGLPSEEMLKMKGQLRDLQDRGYKENQKKTYETNKAVADDSKEMVEGAKAYFKSPVAPVTLKGKIAKAASLIRDAVREHDPADFILDRIGPKVREIWKGPIDEGRAKADEITSILTKPILDLRDKLKITREEMKRVNIYGIAQQTLGDFPVGINRLEEMGITEIPTLSAKEKAFYDAVRKHLDGPSRFIAESSFKRDFPNEKFEANENYWPMEVLSAPNRIDGPAPRTNIVAGGHLKKRVGGRAEVDIRPEMIFNHLKKVAENYALTPALQHAQDLVNNELVQEKLGNANTQVMQDMLDQIRNRGGSDPAPPLLRIVNTVAKSISNGLMRMNIAPAMKHATLVVNSMGKSLGEYGPKATLRLMGNYVKFGPAIMNKNLASAFLEELKSNAQLASDARTADLSIAELDQHHGSIYDFMSKTYTGEELAKMYNDLSFWAMRNPDIVFRSSLSKAVRETLIEKGVPKEEAMLEGNRAARTVYTSAAPENRAVAFNNQTTKSLYQFQSTGMLQQSAARNSLFQMFKGKGANVKAGNAVMFGAQLSAQLCLDYIATLSISDDKKREKAQEDVFKPLNLLMSVPKATIPFFGAVDRTVTTGQASEIIPSIGVVMSFMSYLARTATAKKAETRSKDALKAAEVGSEPWGLPLHGILQSQRVLQAMYQDLSAKRSTTAPQSKSHGGYHYRAY